MGKTIIQTIGPLYGEPVNGTVFGRPNGSVYVPPSNKVSITLAESYRYVLNATASTLRVCSSTGSTPYGAPYAINWVAEAQDMATYVQLQIYSDSACTQLIASRNRTAGDFNSWGRDLDIVGEVTIEADTTYYLRAQLLNNGSPVATSEVIPIVGVVVS